MPIGLITHLLSRIFSKSGSLKVYLALNEFSISVISLPVTAIFDILAYLNNRGVSNLLSLPVLLYEIFIKVLVISVAYNLSKLKLFLILFLEKLIITAIFVVVILLLSFLLFFSRSKVGKMQESGLGKVIDQSFSCKTLGTKLVVTSQLPEFHSQIG